MRTELPPLKELAGRTASTIEPAAAKAGEAFALLYTIVARLRAEDGCPWDREQSPSSIRNNIVEEAYELVEAITEKDPAHVKEEAGDLFMLASMTAYMFEQQGSFSVEESLSGVAEKLVRRHPHVFGDAVLDATGPGDEATAAAAVVKLWNSIKETKEGRRKRDSILDEVPRHLPPLEKSYKLQKKAAKVGFDWTEVDSVWAKVEEELAEAREASREISVERLEEELGDLLFSVVNLCRFKGVDPSLALASCNDKFQRRFRAVEEGMRRRDLPLDAEHLPLMDELWNEAKKDS